MDGLWKKEIKNTRIAAGVFLKKNLLRIFNRESVFNKKFLNSGNFIEMI